MDAGRRVRSRRMRKMVGDQASGMGADSRTARRARTSASGFAVLFDRVGLITETMSETVYGGEEGE